MLVSHFSFLTARRKSSDGYKNPIDSYDWIWKRKQANRASAAGDEDEYQEPTDSIMSQAEMDEMLRVRGPHVPPYGKTLADTLKRADYILTRGELLQRAVTPTHVDRSDVSVSPPISVPALTSTPSERRRRSRSLDDLQDEVIPTSRFRLSAMSMHSSPGSSPKNSPPFRRRSFLNVHTFDLASTRRSMIRGESTT